MRLEQLYYFSEIAKCNSMSIAAEHLHIAQPSLSLAIKQLEQELEVKLFSRSRKGTYLTNEGQVIYDKVVHILDEISDLYQYKIRDDIQGELTLLITPSFNSAITELIQSVISEFPKVKFTCRLTNARRINQENASWKDYDFILTTIQTMHLEKIRSSLTNHTLFLISKETIHLLCSKQSPYSTQKSISFSRLQKIPLVYFSNEVNGDDFLLTCVEEHGVKLHKAYKCTESSSVPGFITKGTLCSLTTPFILKFHNNSLNKDLVLVPLKEKISVSFVLIAKNNKIGIPLYRIFLNNLKEYYPALANQ